VEHFIRVFSKKYGKRIDKVDTEFIEYLMSHPLKGNVRELRNIVEREVIMSDGGRIDCSYCGSAFQQVSLSIPKEGLNLKETLREIEVQLLRQALEISGSNKEKAAELLGLSLRELRYRLSKYNIL